MLELETQSQDKHRGHMQNLAQRLALQGGTFGFHIGKVVLNSNISLEGTWDHR